MKVGLIGIDSIKEEKKIEIIHQSLKKNLFAIFSPHIEEVHIFAKKYDMDVYSSVNELLHDADAIYFANSLKPNLDFAIQALKKSCHVFIENIYELSMEEIKQLYKLAFEAGALLIIKETILFTPEFKIISEEIHETKIVELDYHFNRILRKQDYFHEVSEAVRAVSACIQSRIKKVNTTTVRIEQNLISFILIFLEFDNGAMAKIKFNNVSQRNDKKMDIFETSDFMEINFIKHNAYKHSYKNGHINNSELKLPQFDALQSEFKNFLSQSKNIKTINISESPEILQDIQATLQIMQKIYN